MQPLTDNNKNLKPGNISEPEIIKGCIKHDRIAQNYLFEKYAKPIFSTIYRIVNNYDAANDVLQDSFIDVFRYIKDFRAESSLKTWITVIAVRKSYRAIKLRKNFDSIDENMDIETLDWNREFTAEYLDKAILSLPEKARAIFVAHAIEGFKHSEIAEMFGISEGTSKSSLNYSKKILQLKLRKLYEG